MAAIGGLHEEHIAALIAQQSVWRIRVRGHAGGATRLACRGRAKIVMVKSADGSEGEAVIFQARKAGFVPWCQRNRPRLRA